MNTAQEETRVGAIAEEVLEAALASRAQLARIKFSEPVRHVYQPLDYAWEPYAQYVRRYGGGRKKAVFLGMNPGPFGMTQTGVPFGEISMVRDWMGISAHVGRPKSEHPKRPVLGFGCERSEVSGRRFWGLFAELFGSAENFFANHFVLSYCPLTFCSGSGANLTPDKLPAKSRLPLQAACDEHLVRCLRALRPSKVIGIGNFAAGRAKAAAQILEIDAAQILHPSPASPAANKGWAQVVKQQLKELEMI